ncbi:hypothetical protein AX17_006870 [Amanita inopinata Kibby_2008]|nr:hypothetical protein AX17_006870 [Amanita inopinata Kibby_2008]
MYTKAISVAFFLPFVAQSVLATAGCTRSYTVKDGDICDSISAAKNVSTYQLAVVNHGQINPDCADLTPGQTLCLGRTGEDCNTTYVVVPNDTCDDIQSRTGVNSTILHLNNPQINEECTNIYIGEVLCVGQTVQVPPAPGNGQPAVVAPSTAIPANPSATAVHASVTHPAVAHATAPSSLINEEDLPFCDEL